MQAATPEQVKALVTEGISGTKTIGDERHLELNRRLSAQDGALLRIEQMIKDNDHDNRKSRHDIRDILQGVGMSVALLQQQTKHMDGRLNQVEIHTQTLAERLEELALKVEKIQQVSIKLPSGGSVTVQENER